MKDNNKNVFDKANPEAAMVLEIFEDSILSINKSIVLNIQSIEALDYFLLNYRFTIVNGEVFLFWQPFSEVGDADGTVEDKLELILEHYGINVDSHCFVSPRSNFIQTVKDFVS